MMTITASSTGEIILPDNIEDKVRTKRGTIFSVEKGENFILLRNVSNPDVEEVIKKVNSQAKQSQKRLEKLGYTEEDIIRISLEHRRKNRSRYKHPHISDPMEQ